MLIMNTLDNEILSLFVTSENNNSIITNGGVQIGKSVFIKGSVQIKNGLSMNKDLDIRGNALVLGDLQSNSFITRDSIINGNLLVSDFKSTCSFNSKTLFLNVSHPSEFYGGIISHKNTALQNTSINGTLLVSSSSTLQDLECRNLKTLDITSSGNLCALDANFKNTLKCQQLKVQSTLFAGNSNLDNLVCKNTTCLNLSCTDFSSSGNTLLNGSLGVLGSCSLVDVKCTSININKDISILGKSHVVGDSLVGGNFVVDGQLTVSLYSEFYRDLKVHSNISCLQMCLLSTLDSTSFDSGSLILAGGIGIKGNIFTKGNLVVDGTCFLYSALDVFGSCTFNNTTDSKSTSTGSIVLSGGIGIMKSLNVGHNIHSSTLSVQSNSTLYGNLVVYSTDDAESFSSGALQVKGGICISKNLYCGGNVVFTRDLKTFGNIDITKDLKVKGTCSIQQSLDVDSIKVYSTILTRDLQISSNSFTLGNTLDFINSNGLFHIKSSMAPGLRLSSSTNYSSRYYNSIDLFTLGNNYTDSKFESLQLSNLDNGDFVVATRSLGLDTSPRLILRSGLQTNITLNCDGNVQINDSLTIKNVTLKTTQDSQEYTLTLPNTPPPKGQKSFLVCDENGLLSWQSFHI
jgi:cytoskeletal protein CcmA (bactofilin family)